MDALNAGATEVWNSEDQETRPGMLNKSLQIKRNQLFSTLRKMFSQ